MYSRNLYIVEKYFQCSTIPRRQCGSSFVCRCCLLNMPTSAKFRENLNLSSSRSSKVDDFGTNRKRIGLCDFALAINLWSYIALFLRYGDLLAENCVFSCPSLIRRPRSLCFLRNFAVKLSVKKLESWGYTVVKFA